jgi:CHAT domain-containing protein/tetratricopeptide (TPR) repeat protein
MQQISESNSSYSDKQIRQDVAAFGQYLRIAVNKLQVELAVVYATETSPGHKTSQYNNFSPNLINWLRGAHRLYARPVQAYKSTAEQAVAEAERLRSQWTKASLLQAIKKYREAGSLWHSINHQAELSDTLKRIGDVYLILSQNRKALDYYNRALSLSRAVGSRRLEIDLLNSVGSTNIDLGQRQKTIEYCNEALKLSRESGYAQGEAQAINNIGLVSYVLSDVGRAVEEFNQALAIWRAIGDRRGQAETLTNLGFTYGDMGDLHKALDYFNDALALWQQSKDRRGEARVLSVIGFESSLLGYMQKALAAHRQAGDFFRVVGDRTNEALSFNGVGYVYYLTGDMEKSLNAYKQALQLFQAVGRPASEAIAMGHIGRIYDTLGDKHKALHYYGLKLVTSRSLGDRRMDAYTLKDLGSVYDYLGQRNKALRYYNRALSLSRLANDPRGQAYTLTSIGYVYDRSGQKQKALELYNQALALLRESEDRDRSGELLALNHIVRVSHDLGRLNEVSEQLKTALGLIETLRARVGNQELRTSYFATIRSNYELYVDTLMQMHRQNALAGFDATAFEISERSRARSLLEMLSQTRAEISEGADPVLLQREREVSHLLGVKSDQLAEVLSSKHTQQRASELKKEIANLSNEYQEVRAQLKSTSPRYAALTQPQTLSVAEIQSRVLDSDTVLLEYLLGDDRSYLWVITPSSIKSHELPGRGEIEEVARRVLNLLASYQLAAEGKGDLGLTMDEIDAQYQRQAARLSNILLGPVASELGDKRLLLVADGVLQYIPFPGLPAPYGAGQPKLSASFSEPLVVRHEVISIPSASILAALRQQVSNRARPEGAVAVFADPVFEQSDPRFIVSSDRPSPETRLAMKRQISLKLNRLIRSFRSSDDMAFPRLLATRVEAETIIACAKNGASMKSLDFDASLETVTRPETSRYRILHFATHGLLDSEHPEMSAIVLSLVDKQGNPQNGFLRLHDIYNLNLPVELVVLSACNTALGKDIKGEGLIGMTRGFMYAGAARVVASLWKVDDDATAELMKCFYQKMLEEGERPAAALRAAQVKMWERKQWRAPYYWAAFAFQGEWR